MRPTTGRLLYGLMSRGLSLCRVEMAGSMQITKRTENWSRWAGGLSDLDDAGRIAAAYLKQWTGDEPPVRVVAALPRRVEEADNLSDFNALVDGRDLALIESLKIEIGGLTGPRVSIHAERRSTPALALEVSGNDKVQVNGLYDEVRLKLDRGKQVLSSGAASLLIVFAGVGAAFAGLFMSRRAGWLVDTPSDPAASIGSPGSTLNPLGLALIAGLVVIALSIGLQALPSLEILPEGRGSALGRWRTRIGGAIAAVILGVVASGLWGTIGQ